MRLLPLLMLLAGLPVSVILSLLAAPGAAQATVVIPPWRDRGLAEVLATGLPLIDMRWSGAVVMVDLGAPGAWSRVTTLRDAGFLVLRAAATAGCAEPILLAQGAS